MEVVRITESNRTVGSTAMNERSSRGHTIFRITYERREASDADAAAGWLPGGGGGDASVEEEGGGDEDKENDDARRDYHLRKGGGGGSNCRTRTRSGRKVITTVSSLNLVDLAGSESVRVTGATGERQKEGGKINQRSVNIYIYIYIIVSLHTPSSSASGRTAVASWRKTPLPSFTE
jgi:centromeric protein E